MRISLSLSHDSVSASLRFLRSGRDYISFYVDDVVYHHNRRQGPEKATSLVFESVIAEAVGKGKYCLTTKKENQ